MTDTERDRLTAELYATRRLLAELPSERLLDPGHAYHEAVTRLEELVATLADLLKP